MLPKAYLQTRHSKAAQCELCNWHGVTVYHSHRRVVASHRVFEGSLAGGYTLACPLLNISERDAPSKRSYWKLWPAGIFVRSEERRVGKEGRAGWSTSSDRRRE